MSRVMHVRLSWTDVKLGLRMLVKSPGLTFVGGLGLAVAVAISAGSFAFFFAHLYPTLPLPDGDRIVAVENWNVQVNNEDRRSLHDFVVWRDELKTIQELGAFRTVTSNLVIAGRVAEAVQVAHITAKGLQLARVPPLMGRTLTEADEREGAPRVVIIGQEIWQTRFASDPNVIGRDVRLGDTVYSVVGVMPAGFGFPLSHRVWTALTVNPATYRRGEAPAIFVFGRLAPGATMERAQAELTMIGQRTAAAFPETHRYLRPDVIPYTYSLTDLHDIGEPAVFLASVQFFVSLVLVIVCVNVAVLVYARTAMRQNEMAVRTALGATRVRIVAQLFVEALILSAASAAAGLALGQFGLRLGNQIMAQEFGAVPFWISDRLAPQTVAYVAGLTLLIGVIIGVLPALQATGRRLQSGLREIGSSRVRLGRVWTILIVAQVAVAVAGLPAVAILTWKEIPAAITRPTFASPEFVVALAAADPPAVPLPDAAASRVELSARFGRFQSELLQRLAAEPAVESATVALSFPGTELRDTVEVEGLSLPQKGSSQVVRVGRVASNFFDAIDAHVVAGRTFQPGDETTQAVVVDQTFVRRVLGGADAIGKRVRYVRTPARSASAGSAIYIRPGDATESQGPEPWHEIIGVVGDLQSNLIESKQAEPARVFHAVGPGASAQAFFVVRVRGGNPESVLPRVRELATAIDPSVRLLRAGPFDTFREQEHLALRLISLAFVLISSSVLLLSAAGIYAMMSFAVTQRRREIGIRAALGANAREILMGILGRAVRQLVLGVIAGALLVAALDPVLSGEMLSEKGMVLVLAVVLVMLFVGGIATFGPARRALRVQVTSALRDE